MAEWVALRPILEVCDRETGYEGGVILQEPWWRQTATRKQLRATLKDILAAERLVALEIRQAWRGRGDRDA